METKEIEVWVHRSGDIKNWYIAKDMSEINNKYKHDYITAKLIIEVPEPKKEFTPSQIRKVVSEKYKYYGIESRHINRLIKELFGEEVE